MAFFFTFYSQLTILSIEGTPIPLASILLVWLSLHSGQSFSSACFFAGVASARALVLSKRSRGSRTFVGLRASRNESALFENGAVVRIVILKRFLQAAPHNHRCSRSVEKEWFSVIETGTRRYARSISLIRNPPFFSEASTFSRQ